jgi:hypothetical protein
MIKEKIDNAKIDEVIVLEGHSYLKDVTFDFNKEGVFGYYSYVMHSKTNYWRADFPLRDSNNVMTWKTLNGAKKHFINHYLKDLINTESEDKKQ